MVYLVTIFVYLFVLTGIGVYKSRQVKTQEDFAVAGRSLSPWVMVCTMLAVWIGTGSIVGNAGQAYRDGMAALVLPFGTFIGMILLSQLAMRARNLEASTVPEIIASRYGGVARGLAVFALITAYMGSPAASASDATTISLKEPCVYRSPSATPPVSRS